MSVMMSRARGGELVNERKGRIYGGFSNLRDARCVMQRRMTLRLLAT